MWNVFWYVFTASQLSALRETKRLSMCTSPSHLLCSEGGKKAGWVRWGQLTHTI